MANYKANLKEGFSKKEVTNALWGVGAVGTWLILPSLLKKYKPEWLDGWGGFAVASIGTYLTGAIFKIPALRYSAVAIATIHLAYAKGSGFLSENGLPIWRLGGDSAVTPNPQSAGGHTPDASNGDVGSLSAYIRSGEGYDYIGREAELNGLSQYVTQPQLEASTSSNGLMNWGKGSVTRPKFTLRKVA